MHIRTIDHCVFTNFFSKKPNIAYDLISTQAHVSVGNVNFLEHFINKLNG